MSFIGHPHVHCEYSPIDGGGNRNQLACAAARAGQKVMGFTNHGRLGGALEHVDACRHPEKYDDPFDEGKKRSKDERIIPILGIEAYWRPDVNMDLSDQETYGKNGHNWAQHLCLHAASLTGWRTIMRLSSKSWVKREHGGGHYGKPCIDWRMFEDDHEDVIVSTACMSSPVSQLILAGDIEGAYQWCEDMLDLVGNRFIMEVMPHDLDQQRVINLAKIEIADALGIPYMASGDVHIPFDGLWEDLHETIWCIATRTTMSKREAQKDAGEEVYGGKMDTIFLSSEQQMRSFFEAYHPDMTHTQVQRALDGTEAWASLVKPYVIGKKIKMPKVSASSKESEKILKGWIKDGMKRVGKDDDYEERWRYEFGVLKDKQAIDYFVLVGDLVRWAKSTDPLPGDRGSKRPVRVGLGRGSAAGSLVSYLIGVTAIDPIAWGLLFERFLNPDRVGMPDIDLDFETGVPVAPYDMDGREICIEYLRRRYGSDHVAAIIAYQTFAPRATIQDVGVALDVPFGRLKTATDTIGDTERDLVKIAAQNEVVAKLAEDFPDAWSQMLLLENQIRRDSRHAGGILITPRPVNDLVPTQLGNDDKSIVTAWADRAEFPVVSDYGLVKLDVLGVTGLAKQQLGVDLILDYYDEIFEPNDLEVLRDPLGGDQRVIDLFTKGMTHGIFQFGGRGITNLLRHIKPTAAVDVAVANALYRPGPIKEAFKYGDRKNGLVPEREWYWHEAVEPVLKETLGIVAFQEQVMEMTKVLGDFTGGQADSMRKAISKLYRLPGDEARAFMQGYYDQWMKGCARNGLNEHDSNMIWQAILEFAGYGFNKSHSASYALQAYQDMHIKRFYPLAFYAALLTIEHKQKREEQEAFLRGVLREAKVLEVEALRPDINMSKGEWTIENGKIRYGLATISGIGDAVAGMIEAHRPYPTFNFFQRKMGKSFGVGHTVTLLKAGAFDDIADSDELLARTAKFDKHKSVFKVVYECGCKGKKTVSLNKAEYNKMENNGLTAEEIDQEFQDKIDDVFGELRCKKHDTPIKERELEDDRQTVAEYMKAHKRKPTDYELPTTAERLEMEREVLFMSLTAANVVNEYHDYIENKIFTEEEVEQLPGAPARSGKKHGLNCGCDDCEASRCVVGGEVVSMKVIQTKQKKEDMAFVTLAFGANTYEVTFFPFVYQYCKDLLGLKDTAILVQGKKDPKGTILAADAIDVLELASDENYDPKKMETA